MKQELYKTAVMRDTGSYVAVDLVKHSVKNGDGLVYACYSNRDETGLHGYLGLFWEWQLDRFVF